MNEPTVTFDPTVLNRALLRMRSRAERLNDSQVVDSFAQVGLLYERLQGEDHQVIFGRRGTGKTHALRYLANSVHQQGQIAIMIDMLNLGSDVSIYNDESLSISERATRLLIDVMVQIQEGLLDYATSGASIDLNAVSRAMDMFTDATSQVRVQGTATNIETNTASATKSNQVDATLEVAQKGILGRIGARLNSTAETGQTRTRTTQGTEVLTVRFPDISAAVREFLRVVAPKRVWLIFDEWSSLPQELQPFLVDLLKRAFFNFPQITVKIGAVEHRTVLLREQDGENIGIEPTADIRMDLRLDDFLLFDNDPRAATAFFQEFLFRHVRSVCRELGLPEPENSSQLISRGFSQRTAFEEFVKSVEGVPRDAIHIISNCAQKSSKNVIDTPTVRQAAHSYYQEDKSSQVEQNDALRDLLRFIIDHAIRQKRTNSFLLEVGVRDRNVDLLFDRRLVHIRQRNVSSRDNPGVRYYHYKIDYGCYIDQIATKLMPKEADFRSQDPIGEVAQGVEVPTEDDARSYRRSILDLQDFYRAHPQYQRE